MLCKCGCGLEAPKNKGFKRNHRLNLKAKLCICGCGELAKPGSKFILGHNTRILNNFNMQNLLVSTGIILPPFKGKHHVEESNLKNSLSHKDKKPWNIGLTKETDSRVKENWMNGKTKETDIRVKNLEENKERKEKISKTEKEQYKNGRISARKGKTVLSGDSGAISQSKKIRELCTLPEHMSKLFTRKEMSYAEKEFQKIIEEYQLPFYFNGTLSAKNSRLIVERKIPDFVHNTKKKVIEIWGEHWHKGQNPQDRIDIFNRNGYDCIVFWAKELKDKNIIMTNINTLLEDN